MVLDYLSQLPPWASQVVWSLVAILCPYFIGLFLSHTIGRWLAAAAEQTPWKWDGPIIHAVRQGVPVWAILVGLRVALGFWRLTPQLVSAFSSALFVLFALSLTVILSGLAGRLITLYSGRFQQALPVTSLTHNIAKIFVIAIGALMILHGLGISIAPLLTALGVGGIAVALALQDTLSNLFAGFYLTVTRHIRVGDYVKLDSGQEGYVEDIGWRATMIRMLPNNMVIVPNNRLAQAVITNYYLPSKDLAVLVEVGVAYDSDLPKVERVTAEVGREVMQTVTGGAPDFEPFIRLHTLGEYSINFTVILRAKEFVDQYYVKHQFIKRLVARYRQEGITIPFPTRTVLAESAE
jgi:small-conductance mechanosensitive channel